MTTLQMADQWAAEVWKRNEQGWEKREQDLNYRQYLARPAMRKILSDLKPIRDGVFLDLGCGDGRESLQILESLAKQGNTGTFYGFDFQEALIKIAKQKIYPNSFDMQFDSGNLQPLIKKHSFLLCNTDRVFSTFLIQELSNAYSHFQLVDRCLKKGGIGVFLLLDPAFGDAMRRKGTVRIKSNLKSEYWRWAAEYPIVEENGKTFYVPYFHRELEDYVVYAKKFFSSIKSYAFKPSPQVAKICRKQKITPFYNHLGNAYFPEILDITSALFLVVIK